LLDNSKDELEGVRNAGMCALLADHNSCLQNYYKTDRSNGRFASRQLDELYKQVQADKSSGAPTDIPNGSFKYDGKVRSWQDLIEKLNQDMTSAISAFNDRTNVANSWNVVRRNIKANELATTQTKICSAKNLVDLKEGIKRWNMQATINTSRIGSSLWRNSFTTTPLLDMPDVFGQAKRKNNLRL